MAYSECLPTFFEQLGYDISDSQSAQLSAMVEEAVSYYVDESVLDNSFATFNFLLRSLISWSVEAPERITDLAELSQVNTALDSVIGWGEKCEMDETQINRGGFCRFSVRKIAAAHSFAQFVTQEYPRNHSVDRSVQMLSVKVERDGKTGASLSNHFTRLFYGDDADLVRANSLECSWLISAECQEPGYNASSQDSNLCGVPHAWIAEKDNLLIPPYELYWENTANDGVVAWLNGESLPTADDANFMVRSQWDQTRAQCIFIDTMAPPKSLVADTPSVLRLKLNVSEIGEALRTKVLDDIANVSGTPRGLLELGSTLMSDGTMSVFLDGDGADILDSLLRRRAVSQIGEHSISSAQLKGQRYDESELTVQCAVTKDGEEDGAFSAAQMIGFVIGAFVFGALAMCAVLLFCVKCRGYEVTRGNAYDDKQYALMTNQAL